MNVVRKSEGGTDEEEMRRKSKREKLNSMWEDTHKTKNGPECAWWCCQQCLVFISCLVLTPVWLATAWLAGVSHLLDQSVRRQRVCCLNVLFSCQQAWRATQPTTVQGGPRLYDRLVSVCISCCTEMSVWVDAVSSLVSVPVWLSVQALACFNVSFACVSKWVRRRGKGPSVAQRPKLPTL